MIRRFVGPILPGREKFSAGSQKSILSPEYGKRSCISKIAKRRSSRQGTLLELQYPTRLKSFRDQCREEPSFSSRLFIAYPLRNRSSAVSSELAQSKRSLLHQTGTNSNCGNSDKKRPPAKSRR